MRPVKQYKNNSSVMTNNHPRRNETKLKIKLKNQDNRIRVGFEVVFDLK